MYNHYIPQSDGSYRRNSIPDPNRRPQNRPPQHHAAPPPPKPEPKPEPRPDPPPKEPEKEEHCPQAPVQPCQSTSGEGILSFLKGLLPRDIDSTDLLVILLLLLMNKDEDGDGLSPMLTLALYFLL